MMDSLLRWMGVKLNWVRRGSKPKRFSWIAQLPTGIGPVNPIWFASFKARGPKESD